LRYSFGLSEEADCIEKAVDKVLNAGYRTADIMGNTDGTPLTCTEMTEKVLEAL
ncbi:MAG: 3-isopropylmalate dehydrogenase, partial [Ruminococcus sp.]|nr:3-isopropylmalate dehydrogenase [Ruminococcus sp.]